MDGTCQVGGEFHNFYTLHPDMDFHSPLLACQIQFPPAFGQRLRIAH